MRGRQVKFRRQKRFRDSIIRFWHWQTDTSALAESRYKVLNWAQPFSFNSSALILPTAEIIVDSFLQVLQLSDSLEVGGRFP